MPDVDARLLHRERVALLNNTGERLHADWVTPLQAVLNDLRKRLGADVSITITLSDTGQIYCAALDFTPRATPAPTPEPPHEGVRQIRLPDEPVSS